MGIIASLALIVCGALAAATFVVQKQPNAQQAIDKLRPAQGWIGLIVGIWGLWIVIWDLLNVGAIRVVPILWLVILATGLLSLALGFLLGYPLINELMLSKNPEAQAKGEALRAKLTPLQTPLGLAGMGLGVLCLILELIY